MRDIQEKYGDRIYRPGEDDIDDLTPEELTEHRRKVVQMFESGKTEFDGTEDT